MSLRIFPRLAEANSTVEDDRVEIEGGNGMEESTLVRAFNNRNKWDGSGF